MKTTGTHEYNHHPEPGAPELTARAQDFHVGRWLVRPPHNLISQDSGDPEERQLEPRLMKLLCLLASRPGDVVGRQTLMDSLWPDTIVNENSLTRAVSDLRRSLEDGQTGCHIETVPKRGYKLVAPVTEASPPVEAETVKVEPRERVPGGHWRWIRRNTAGLAVTNTALTLVLLVALVPALLTGPDPAAPAAPITDWRAATDASTTPRGDTVRQESPHSLFPALTRTTGSEQDADTAAISPDGELMAFTRRTDEGSTLMIGSTLDSTDPLQVYATRHRIAHLQWSPIGSALLFSVLPTVSHAALGEPDTGRLMLFDLRELSLREVYRSEEEAGETPDRFNDALNIT
ncbi:MAG: winged helix-turn-helix domain-containing protein [Pseudomonadota bacterium]